MFEAIRNGYEYHYNSIGNYVSDTVITPQQSRLVLDILNLFKYLNYAYQELEDKSGVDESKLRHIGFDATDETEYYEYLVFLVETAKEYVFLDYAKDFDTHVPMLSAYRQMLLEWEICNKPIKPTKDEIIRITSVR